jgi:hypothetical protein
MTEDFRRSTSPYRSLAAIESAQRRSDIKRGQGRGASRASSAKDVLLGAHKRTMQAQRERHGRSPGAYGSVGNMARIKDVQFRFSGA